jgi:hypothetical protein
MTPEENQIQKRLRARVTRIVSWVAGLSVGSLIFIVFVSLAGIAVFSQTETFQTWLRDRVVEVAQDTLEIEIDYETADLKVFRFFPELSFSGVHLKDSRSAIEVDIEKVGVSISAILSLPMLLWNKIYISEARVEGLSYHLKDLAVLEDWKERLRPKRKAGGIGIGFQTIVHRISFQDFLLDIDVPVQEKWLDRFQAELRLDRFSLRIDGDRTYLNGKFSFSRIDLGDYIFREGSVEIQDSFAEYSLLQIGEFKLQTADDFFQVSGQVDFQESPILDIKALVRVKLENYVKTQPLSGGVSLEGSLKGPAESLVATGKLDGSRIQWRDRSWENLKVNWNLRENTVRLDPLEWEQGPERGRLVASIPFQRLEQSRWTLSLLSAPFGDYLGLADKETRNFEGRINLEASGIGVPLLSRVDELKLTGSVAGLNIVNADGKSVYRAAGDTVQMEISGSSDEPDEIQIVGSLQSDFAELPIDLKISRQEIDLVVNANVDSSYAGTLFDFDLGVRGFLGLRLFGPIRQPRLELSPNLELMTLSQMQFEEVRGKFIVLGRQLWGENLRSKTVTINGGLRLQPDGAPALFENLQFQMSGANLDRVIGSIQPAALEAKYRLRGLASGAGHLNGPITRPSGVGEIAIQDFSILEDRVKGRQLQASWRFSEGNFDVTNLITRTSRDGGSIEGQFSLVPGAGLQDFNLVGKRIRLSDWFSLFEINLPFQTFADFTASQSAQNSRLELKGRLTETSIGAGRLGDSSFDLASVDGRLSGKLSLIGDQLNGVLDSADSREARLRLNLVGLQIPQLLRTLQSSNLRMNLGGSGECISRSDYQRGSSSELQRLIDTSRQMDCRFQMKKSILSRGQVELHQIDSFSVELGRNENSDWSMVLPGVNLRTGEKTLRLKGSFTNSERFLWEFSGESALDTVSYFLPFLNRSSGLLHVEGSWDQDGFDGSVELDDGVLFFQDSPLVLRSGTARLRSENSKFQIRTLTGDFRDGNMRATGSFHLNQLQVVEANINVQLNGPLIEPQTGLRFRLNGPLKLMIDSEGALVEGDLQVFEGSFRRRLNVRTDILKAFQSTQTEYGFFEQSENYIDTWRLNIGLVSTAPFLIRNNIADGEADLNLRVLGTIGRPNVQGGINVRRGRFSYFNRTFDIQSGAIQFSDNQTNIPRYDIRAQTQVAEYLVSINLIGDADEQRLIYSSDPPLSEREILALVSYGMPPAQPDDFRDEDLTTQAAYAGISFVTGQLQDTLEGALSTDFGIQRFQLFPAFFDETGRTELQLKVGTDLIRNRLELNYFNFVTAEGGHQLQLDFRVNRNVSLIGGWRQIGRGRDQNNASGDFGGDIIFRFEFD